MDTGKSDSTETERPTGSRSSQEDSWGHAEMEFKMSVTVSRDWIDAMKSHDDAYYDCKDVITQIVSNATDSKRHNVEIKCWNGTWTLEGCFCCIQKIREALRKALQDKIRKKQARENNDRLVLSESAQDLGNDQESHNENVEKESTDLNDITPEVSFEQSTCGKVEIEQSRLNIGNFSDSKIRNEAQLECQQPQEERRRTLKNGAEDSNCKNLKNPEENNRKQRSLVAGSQDVNMNQDEGKGAKNSGDTEVIHQLKKEDTMNNETHKENVKQQTLYPSLPENSETQGDSINTNQKDKEFQNENRGGTNSGYSKGRDELNKDGKPQDVRNSENIQHQDLAGYNSGSYTENLRQSGQYQSSVNCGDTERLAYLHEGSMLKDNQKRQENCTVTPTPKNLEHRDNLKDAAGRAESKGASGLHGNKTQDQERDRICALNLLPYMFIDEDKFNYLVQCRDYELSRISQKFNVFELYKDVGGHKLAFQAKQQYSTDSVMAEFRELYTKATRNFNCTNVDIPEGVDPESLKGLVETMNEFKDVALRLIRQKRALRIVGPSREFERARKTLKEVIASNRSVGHGFNTAANKRADQIRPITPTHHDPRNVPLYSAVAAINVNQPRTSIFTILNKSHDSLILSALNSLTIEVKRDDLTSIQNVDVVVSYITHQLDVVAPLAIEVIGAAGPNVRMELFTLKNQLSFLHTGRLVHTHAGNLRGVKLIIHVVPPEVWEFPFGDFRTREALRSAFINCFRHTNDVLMMQSICLPPVGFSSYGAEMVVDCFLDAVKMFAETVANPLAATSHQPHPHHLSLIQLVAKDHISIDQLLQCIKRRV